jgi:hypothetical protein
MFNADGSLPFIMLLGLWTATAWAQTPEAAPADRAAAPADRAPIIAATAPRDAISLKAIEMFNVCQQREDGPPGSLSPYDSDPWFVSYHMMAYLAMFEGTGERQYLDRLLEHVEHIMGQRGDRLGLVDEIRGRTMPAWTTTGYSEGKPYAWLVHAGMIAYPMARCAYLLERDPQLAQQYAPVIQRLLTDVAETLHAFDEDWRDGPGQGPNSEGYYYCPYLQRDLPFNMQNAMGRTMVAMYLATGDDWYRTRAHKLAYYFHERLQRLDGDTRFCWSYWVRNPSPEDVSHAAINVDFAFVCRRAGIVFDKGDIGRFVAAFKHVAKPEGFGDFVDGSRTGGSLSVQLARWGHLAYHDPSVRTVLSDYLEQSEGATATLIGCAYLVETQRSFHKEQPVAATTAPAQP